MMGRTHALTGWCAGSAAAGLLGYHQLEQAVLLAATTAGFALLPDLDHPQATPSRLLGPVTKGLSWLLRKASETLYGWTKGPRDERCRGGHRHLTHTLMFAVLLGAATALGVDAGGPWVAVAIVTFGLLLAEAALGDWVLLLVAPAALAWLLSVDEPLQLLTDVNGWLGLAVTLGCIVHCLGDALTESGCPFLWPIPIAGETWYELGPPKPLRFKTGKTVEQLLVFPTFALLAIWLTPGVAEAITTLTTQHQPT